VLGTFFRGSQKCLYFFFFRIQESFVSLALFFRREFFGLFLGLKIFSLQSIIFPFGQVYRLVSDFFSVLVFFLSRSFTNEQNDPMFLSFKMPPPQKKTWAEKLFTWVQEGKLILALMQAFNRIGQPAVNTVRSGKCFWTKFENFIFMRSEIERSCSSKPRAASVQRCNKRARFLHNDSYHWPFWRLSSSP